MIRPLDAKSARPSRPGTSPAKGPRLAAAAAVRVVRFPVDLRATPPGAPLPVTLLTLGVIFVIIEKVVHVPPGPNMERRS